MPGFEYKATDSQGEQVSGVVEAESRMMATVKLREQGLHLHSLKQQTKQPSTGQQVEGPHSLLYPLRPISAQSLSDFYAQLAELLAAGIPIHEAFDVLPDRVDRRLRPAVADIAPKLGEGDDPTELLANYPQIFPAHIRAMVKAGQLSGNLDQACKAIATEYEQENQLHQKLRWAKLYYGLVIGLAALVAPFPWIISRGFGWYGHLLLTRLLPVAGGLIALALALRILAAVRPVKALIDGIIFRLPWLAPFGMRAARTRLLQAMHVMTRSGADMPSSLELAAQAAGIGPMESQLRIAAAKVRAQMPVTQALADCDALAEREKRTLATAEQTGLYAEALQRLATAAATERRAVISRILTGSVIGFLLFTAVPVAMALYFAYSAYINAILERTEEWMP